MHRKSILLLFIIPTILTITFVSQMDIRTENDSAPIASTSYRERLLERDLVRSICTKKNPDGSSVIQEPGVEYYVHQRTFGSSIPVSVGKKRAAIALQEIQSNNAFQKFSAVNPWASMGPNNYGGRMRALAFHPTDPSIIYAGAASGGLWKSTDGGRSWLPKTDRLPSLAVGAIAIDKNNPNRIFIGTGEGSRNWDRVYGDGIFRSEDGGESWTEISSTVFLSYDQACNAIALHPQSADTMFIAMAYLTGNSGGVFKTTNGGASWSNVLAGFARDVVIDPFNPSRVFVALGHDNGKGSNGIYRSDEYGKRFTFKACTTGIPINDSIGRIKLASSPSNPNTVIAAIVKAPLGSDPKDLLGIYRTTDAGDRWERMPCSDNTTFQSFMSTSGSPQGWYNLFLAFHPTDHNYVYAGGIDIWRSTNFGAQFTRISSNNDPGFPVHVDQHTIAFDPMNPNSMFIGNDGGIYRTTNNRAASVAWEEMNNNLVTFQFYEMDYNRQMPTRVYGGTQDNGTNQGDVGNVQWKKIYGSDGGYVASDPVNAQIVYATTQYGKIQKSLNGGASFNSAQNGIDYSVSPQFVAPFVISPTNSNLLLFGSNIVFRTTNAGANWLEISQTLTDASSWQNQISHIAISKSSPTSAYVVTGNGRCWRSDNITSLAANVSWTRLGSGQLPSLYFTKVAIDQMDVQTVYLATSSFDSTRNGIYKSTDGGQNWIRCVPIGNDGKRIWRFGPCNALEISPKNRNHLFIGTDIGVFVSTDAGDSWNPFGNGLPVVVIDDIKITPNDVIYAATHGRGMWMASSIVSVGGEKLSPGDFALHQNFPNPVSMKSGLSTTIRFKLPARKNVTMKLFDAQGRLLQTMLKEVRNSGEHSLSVDVHQLRSGTYFYELTAGNFRDVRKMAVVR